MAGCGKYGLFIPVKQQVR